MGVITNRVIINLTEWDIDTRGADAMPVYDHLYNISYGFHAPGGVRGGKTKPALLTFLFVSLMYPVMVGEFNYGVFAAKNLVNKTVDAFMKLIAKTDHSISSPKSFDAHAACAGKTDLFRIVFDECIPIMDAFAEVLDEKS